MVIFFVVITFEPILGDFLRFWTNPEIQDDFAIIASCDVITSWLFVIAFTSPPPNPVVEDQKKSPFQKGVQRQLPCPRDRRAMIDDASAFSKTCLNVLRFS